MKKIFKTAVSKSGAGTLDSAPFGWLAFGLTVLLLSLHNAGLYAMNSMVAGTALFLGGMGLVVAGIMESRKASVFGMTAFLVYGFFWLSLVAVLVLPVNGWAKSTGHSAMAVYVLVWGLVTVGMFFASLKTALPLQVFFGSLALMFLLLSMNDFTGKAVFQYGAGYVGILSGISALYAGFAGLLNDIYGRKVLPV